MWEAGKGYYLFSGGDQANLVIGENLKSTVAVNKNFTFRFRRTIVQRCHRHCSVLVDFALNNYSTFAFNRLRNRFSCVKTTCHVFLRALEPEVLKSSSNSKSKLIESRRVQVTVLKQSRRKCISQLTFVPE